MISILKLILKPVEKLRDWIEPNYDAMILNPYVPDKFLLKNRNKIKSKYFLYTDPKLMDKFPEFVEWNYVRNDSYNNDNFADLWIKHADRITNKGKIIANTNPKMAKLILETIRLFPLNRMQDYLWGLASNENPGLTDYLTTNWNKLPNTKFLNKNPKLFDLMMSDPNPYWNWLSTREEPEFADFLIKNEKYLNIEEILKNSNPGLTEFIINISYQINKYCLSENKNPGLLELKKRNKDKLNWRFISTYGKDELLLENLDLADWLSLSDNENQELTEILINSPDKVNYNEIALNSNKKLIKFKEAHEDKFHHFSLCSRSNIMEINSNFCFKLAQQLG
jgi:hypothetical protein